jgi:hypothetical protein
MFALLRRRRAAIVAGTGFCESCAAVCTAQCRADAHYDRARTRALTFVVPIR